MSEEQARRGILSRVQRVVAGVGAALFPLVGLVEPAQAAGFRVELRVLVVTAGDPSSAAIAEELRREGVPHTLVDLTAAGRPVLDEGFLVDAVTGAARFQAVVLPNASPAQLGAPELDALAGYERAHGIRRVNAYVYPGTGSGATATYAGSLDGADGEVTAAARASGFSALSGALPIDDFSPALEVYGYLAQPEAELPAGQSVTPMITASTDDATGMIAWSYAHGGREELMVSAAYNSSMQWYNTVAHGVVSWMTRGIHLGFHRSYLDVQVDDVFLPDSRWSVAGNCTPGDDCVDPGVRTDDIRMTAADVDRLVAWQRAHGFRLDMVFNGSGAEAARAAGGRDPLTDAFLASKAEFPWVNHTWSHPYLGCIQVAPTVAGQTWRCATRPDETPRQDPEVPAQESGGVQWASQEFLRSQVQRNIDWARANGLPNFDASELVTGEHSGLATAPQQPTDNPFLAPALAATGVKHIASDASREGGRRLVGDARTVPRYPMNVYYNTGTYREQIDEYNWYYTSRADGGSGICEDNPASTCIAPLPAATEAEARTSFEGYLAPLEVRNALLKVLANDPRSFYAHQSNLAEDALLYPVVEGVLEQYRATHTPDAPLVQIPLRVQGDLLVKGTEWRRKSSQVSAYLDDSGVHLSGPADTYAPLTVPSGTREVGIGLRSYGGERSGWFRVPTADTVVAVPELPRGAYVGTTTPVTVPAYARAVSAVPGNASATVTWTAPTLDGGSALTGYSVRAWAVGAGTPAVTAEVPAERTTAIVEGLLNGTAYTFEVVARNPAGEAPPSERSAPVVPRAPAVQPGAPVLGAVTAGDTTATVTWSAPGSDGGAPVSGYTVHVFEGGATAPTRTVGVAAPTTRATVTGLVNGTPYAFEVLARNSAGEGLPSPRSATVVPATVPGAPIVSGVTAGNASAGVTWNAPATDGGSAVTGYQVRAYAAGASTPARTLDVPATSTSGTVTGLVNGTTYTVEVVARNAVGTGAASPRSAAVLPATVPGAPVLGSVAAGNATASVTWNAPADNGGSAVTAYTVRVFTAGSSTPLLTVDAAATARSLTVGGLANGTGHTLDVTARNSAGTGPASQRSATVTPVAVPGAPVLGSVTAGDQRITLAWTAPRDTGGSTLTGYRVRRYDGRTGALLATTAVAATATSFTLTGLVNGTGYTVDVQAVNAAGAGQASQRSAVVVPLGRPGAPVMQMAWSGYPFGHVTAFANWSPPTNTGGSPVTGYRVRALRIDWTGQTVEVITYPQLLPATARSVEMYLPWYGRYRFQVQAVNAVGVGEWSAQSNDVQGQ
ncbi:fibronectin type III domain-containing protein [Kineococcus sp. NUM-3379]